MKVYIAPRKGYDHYHTNEGCWSLNQANRVREVEMDGLDDDIEECTACAGGYERDYDRRTSLRDKIANGEIDTENL